MEFIFKVELHEIKTCASVSQLLSGGAISRVAMKPSGLAQVSLSYSREVLSHVCPWNLADSRLESTCKIGQYFFSAAISDRPGKSVQLRIVWEQLNERLLVTLLTKLISLCVA